MTRKNLVSSGLSRFANLSDSRLSGSRNVWASIVLAVTVGWATGAQANLRCEAPFEVSGMIEPAVGTGASPFKYQAGNEASLRTLFRHGRITSWSKVSGHIGQNEVFVVAFEGTTVRAVAKALDQSERGVDISVYQISERTGLKNYPFTTERTIKGKRYVMHLFLEGYSDIKKVAEPDRNHPSYLRQMVLEFIAGDVDHSGSQLMYNPLTKHWAYIDATSSLTIAERGLSLDLVDPFKPWGKRSFAREDYFADRELFDAMAKLDPEVVFANLPVKDSNRASLVPYSKLRFMKLQAQIRELQMLLAAQ